MLLLSCAAYPESIICLVCSPSDEQYGRETPHCLYQSNASGEPPPVTHKAELTLC